MVFNKTYGRNPPSWLYVLYRVGLFMSLNHRVSYLKTVHTDRGQWCGATLVVRNTIEPREERRPLNFNKNVLNYIGTRDLYSIEIIKLLDVERPIYECLKM